MLTLRTYAWLSFWCRVQGLRRNALDVETRVPLPRMGGYGRRRNMVAGIVQVLVSKFYFNANISYSKYDYMHVSLGCPAGVAGCE